MRNIFKSQRVTKAHSLRSEWSNLSFVPFKEQATASKIAFAFILAMAQRHTIFILMLMYALYVLPSCLLQYMWVKISRYLQSEKYFFILGYLDFARNFCFISSLQKNCSKNNYLKCKAGQELMCYRFPSALLMDLHATNRVFLFSLARHFWLPLSCATLWYNHTFCRQKMSASALHILVLHHINNALNLPRQGCHPSPWTDPAMGATLMWASGSLGCAWLTSSDSDTKKCSWNLCYFLVWQYWKLHWNSEV